MTTPWRVLLGCALALVVSACFNPQPEPPGRHEESPDDGGGVDAATGTAGGISGNGGAGGGGAGGQGGAGGASTAPFDLSDRGVTVTTGGNPTNLVDPHTPHPPLLAPSLPNDATAHAAGASN